MVSWLVLAVALFVVRYLRHLVNWISHLTFRPIPPPRVPTYFSEDVTGIIPTIDGDGHELLETIRSMLKCRLHEVILVTIDANVKRALKTAQTFRGASIRVLSVREPNKRRQMCRAIGEVQTKITVFADDDVIWPEKIMPWILAPFEEPAVGGVGTSQRLKRPERPGIWSYLGAAYLERRNFDCSACLHIDGGLPCLSGRTVAYRTQILQDDDFMHGFTHETWRSFQLNADDDNFITRWMFNHGHKIKMQYHQEAEVQTTLEDGPKYLKQCLRWVRSNWRSNLTTMFVERRTWWYVLGVVTSVRIPKILICRRQQPWSTYAVQLTTLNAWAFTDLILFFVWWRATEGWQDQQRTLTRGFAFFWIFVFSKTIKLWGHFIRYPEDIIYLPVTVLFGQFHGLIKVYGLLTLHETAWGSREAADTHDAFAIRMGRPPAYVLDKEDDSVYANDSRIAL
ncbi:hypothetical protein LTR66_006164 [Elasticomyces elasticus]|nr:hypothetical protein LTR66_006164 [Elasticomyces elasticus]